MKKSDRDIMEVLEAYDTTGNAHSAAQLAGVDPKTVRRYAAARDAGMSLTGPSRWPRIIDDYMPKIEEWVERSKGKVRADVESGTRPRSTDCCASSMHDDGTIQTQPRMALR